MSKNLTDMIKRMDDAKQRVENFSDILDGLDTTTDKKKLLYKEIYENALQDRESAGMLFTDAWKQMSGGTAEHATIGTILSKYLERMCKSNEQILRLAEIISKEEERNLKIDPDDVFDQIGSG